MQQTHRGSPGLRIVTTTAEDEGGELNTFFYEPSAALDMLCLNSRLAGWQQLQQ
jgi:hypothetical protein